MCPKQGTAEPMEPRLQELCARVNDTFVGLYGSRPSLMAGSPGRVNLIGEHTDYNDGFVMPAAINRHVVMAARPRTDRQVHLYALDLEEGAQFDLNDITHAEQGAWSNYERGVAWALQGAGYDLEGFDAVLASDVPIAAGLSSSAAVEVATAFVFQTLGALELDGVQRALLCQKAENEFVGMRCGIMDQYIISLGRRDHALLIDCRSLEYELVPVPGGVSLIICDTSKRRGLVDSEYNTRRQECENGAEALGVPALRDVTLSAFRQRQGELGEITRKRCRHVVSENQRVADAVVALQANDLDRFGALMNASHVSLRDDYEVSCAELDAMVEAAWQQEGVYGARMTGAGFGGCTINLVKQDHAAAFVGRVAEAYTESTDRIPMIYVCKAEDGVRALAVP